MADQTTIDSDVTSRFVACADIRLPKSAPVSRTKSEAFLKQLAASIRVEGQHHPVLIRPDPERPGKYLMVDGINRLTVVRDTLKQDLIEAKVVELTQDLADMATLATNLWRNPYSKAQGLKAIQKWHEYYNATVQAPPVRVQGIAAVKAAARAASEAAEKAPEGETSQTPQPVSYLKTETVFGMEAAPEPPAPAEESPPPKPFVQHYAEATGKSVTSAGVDVRIAKAFTPDELEVFDQAGTNKIDMLAVAAIDDKPKRDSVIKLVVAGLPVKQAIAQLTTTDAAPDTIVQGAKDAEAEAAMTDAEWLQTYCGEFRLLLKAYPETLARYDEDAIYYRQDKDARAEYRKKNKARQKAIAGKTGGRGPFIRALTKLIFTAHPKDWALCGACKGHAKGCKPCWESGYTTRVEILTRSK